MRKLFWGCILGGAAIAAGVWATATYAVRHPDSYVGQFLFGASQAAAVLNPFSNFVPTLAQQDHAPKASGSEEPAEAVEAILESTMNSEPTQLGAIVIPEDEPVPPVPIPLLPDVLSAVEYPESVPAGAAPTFMPRCEDRCEKVERIGIDFNDPAQVEMLRMPSVVDGEEEQESHECPLCGSADKMMRLFQKLMKHTNEKPKCLPQGGCPGTGPGCKTNGLFQTRNEAFCPACQQVDTMEFRETDRPLNDYGFGPL